MLGGTKSIVERLISDHPHLRDDDLKLLATIYWFRVEDEMSYSLTEEELGGIKKFLQHLADGELPNFESIRRCRQKLQEENTFLRGNLYEERHNYQENIKEELMLW